MKTGERPQPETLTREELYERVWSEAMATLGPKLGLSDTGLRKVCEKHRIPTPPRGYWAKKAAGQRLRRPPLPKVPASAIGFAATIVFNQPPKPTPAEQAKAEMEDTGPLAVQRRYESEPDHRVIVAAVLEQPHPLVATSVLLLRKAKVSEDLRLQSASLKCVALSVTLTGVDRALRIYDALFKALEERGHRLALTSAERGVRTVVTVDGEPLALEISEKVTRTELAPLRKDTGWQPKQYVYEATGRLTLDIKESYLGVRTSWSDGTKQRLEDLVNDVIVGLVACAEAIKARRAEQERAEQARRVAEERRLQEEARKRQERARIRALYEDVDLLQQSRAIRDYVASMREAAQIAGLSADHPLHDWLTWADGYADRLDPLKALSVPRDPDPHAEHRSPWSPSPPEPQRSWWQRPWYNR